MLKKTSIISGFILVIICIFWVGQNAFATKWVEKFEMDLKKGHLEEAIKTALNQDIEREDLISALENALEKGIIPEDKAEKVEELLLADNCSYYCDSSPSKPCDDNACERKCACCADFCSTLLGN